MTKIVYISGPMTGYANYNREAFKLAEAKLRGLGYVVINPASFQLGEGATWAEYMRQDIKHLMNAHLVAVLDGWEASEGALLEVQIAVKLGMEVVSFPTMDPVMFPALTREEAVLVKLRAEFDYLFNRFNEGYGHPASFPDELLNLIMNRLDEAKGHPNIYGKGGLAGLPPNLFAALERAIRGRQFIDEKPGVHGIGL